MLVIRLTRTGRKDHATYRIVAAEKARAVQGKYVARLGHYNSHTKELEVDKALVKKYLANGAQPSSSVVRLFKAAKVEMPAWAEANLKVRKRSPKSQDTQAETSAEASEATAAAGAEEPTADKESTEGGEEKDKAKAKDKAEDKDKAEAKTEDKQPANKDKDQPKTANKDKKETAPAETKAKQSESSESSS